MALATELAVASSCGDIYPGALQGPPPEWTFWADGSACYVRWQSSNIPERSLFQKCRQTPGARFIHFEKDHGAGSICVFKILASSDEPAPAASDPAAGHEPGESPQSTQYRKADAETPVLEDLESLVTNWMNRCLQQEKAKAQKEAARCWRDGASALGDFTGARERVLPPQFVVHVKELQDAWGKRSAQLEATPMAVAVTAENETSLRTVDDVSLSAHDGPDPQRLAATAHCSSTRLGDMKRCLRQPRPAGSELYTFGLKASCSSGIIAAVKTHDPSGRCIRKVIWIRGGEASSQPIRSLAEPGVIDAISFKNRAVLECYARRHDQISCDGRKDYGARGLATAKPRPSVAANKVARVKRNYRLRYEQAEEEQQEQPIRYRRKRPNVFDSLSSKLKSLVGSN